jgi:hypothetical protein
MPSLNRQKTVFTLAYLYICMLPNWAWSQGNQVFTKEDLIEKTGNTTLQKISFQISSQYTDVNSGIHHVYLQQYIDDLPLIPVTASYHFDQKNRLVHSTGNLIPDVQSKLVKNPHSNKIEESVKSILAEKSSGLKNIQLVASRNKEDDSGFKEFSCIQLAKDEIKARTCYFLLDDNKIATAYQIHWKRHAENEWLEVIVDAGSSVILFEYNHLLHCDFENTAFERKNLFTVIEEKSFSLPANSYKVFPMPTESPIHGTRNYVTAPWLKAANASPAGWHNDGFYSYYTSKGNNVDAYEDSGDNDYPIGGDDSRAFGGLNLNFDFTFDPLLPPLENKDAAITNLFYWCNMMHDVWYQYGFNEAAGNFQYNNFNKGGEAYDDVIAEGIDNVKFARNNANFGAPPDGYPGVMQLYAWQPPEKDTLIIESPAGIAGKILYVRIPITPDLYAPLKKQVIKVDDGTSYPSYACSNLINTAQLTGKIALVDKGICSFASKMTRIQTAGAVAVIVCNNDDNEPSGIGGFSNGMTIPAVMIRKSDCQKIKLQLQNGVYVTILPSSTLQFKVNQRSFVFSRASFAGSITNMENILVKAKDDGFIETDACDVILNGSELTGKIAIVDEGNCELSYKAMQAQSFGAIALVICKQGNGYPDSIPKGTYGQDIMIPVIELSYADCEIIKANLPSNAQFINQSQQLTDGDFDAGIICHEYGHGISNRIAGGPKNSSCLSNTEQMGEGWSDYFGLIMTMKPTDHAYLYRGMGLYNSGQALNGAGIRPYPYSVDLKVNPADYGQLPDVVKISQPHGIGYIWCSMIWDMTWAMIKAYGFESDIYKANANKGNTKASRLIIEGLRLQPCSPGFVDGRNAILKADTILYGGQHSCILWNIFARRGLGFSASQGSSTRRDDGIAAYNLPPGCSFMSEHQLFFAPQLASYDLKLTAEALQDAIVLHWSIDEQLKSKNWELIRKSDHNKMEMVLLSSANGHLATNSFVDMNVQPGINYYYQLRVIQSKGDPEKTDWISASLSTPREEWSCYPNPVNDQLEIRTSIAENKLVELKLYNNLLQQIEQTQIEYKPGDRLILNCRSLANGHYYLLCGNGNSFTCLRFLKN